MGETFLILIHNAALLITLAYVYSLISVQERQEGRILVKILLGAVVSAIGLSIMFTSWEFSPGVILDTRSVLLAGSGLFLGFIPTIIAMMVTGAFQWVLGGDGVYIGLSTVLASGVIGLLWRAKRRDILIDITWFELYVFGFIVHLVMLGLFFLIPTDEALNILVFVATPVIGLYPLATMLLGRMLSYRLQRERAARQLKESEERYRSLFENNHTVMLITDPVDGQIIDANTAAEEFYGWARYELRLKKIDELNAATSKQTEEEVRLGLDDEQEYTLYRHRLADDQIRYVEIYSGQITIDSRDLRYSIIHDVTDKKHLENQLRQAQKMEAVGRLAGGVAHDYNNKLQAVLGFSEMAIQRAENDPEMQEYIKEIREAAQHSAQLTLQLMAFARKQTVNPKVLDLNDIIEHMLKMLEKLIGEDIDLSWKPGRDIWHVKMDPSQVDQILVNLALNARDAIPDIGKLTIEAHNMVIEEGSEKMNPDAVPGEYVMLSVTDTGKGMTQDELEHLFEPFFTTKAIGKGTGLGLATVYGIVRQNGGFIHVHSALGHGSAFKLYIPRCIGDEDVVPEASTLDPNAPARGTETVLLVEDEKLILDLVQKTLELYGYTVLAAEIPEKAIELAEQYDGKIDIMVTDVVMPGMNGRVLYETLVKSRTNMNVLYMSGYTANAIAHRGILDTGIHFLQKPFSGRMLATKVREVLDGDSLTLSQ